MTHTFPRLTILFAALACGEQVQPSADAGVDAADATSSDGLAFGDVALEAAIDAAPPPTGPCPTSPPTVDAGCSSVGLECEYGTSWYVRCDAVYVCTSTGWAGGTSMSCPNAGGCPADSDAGSACTSSVGPCDYADRHCECAQQCGGPCCGGTAWHCYVPSKQGCPYPRPNVGTACSNEGQTCAYGDCCNGSLLECSGGLWRHDTCVPPP